MISPQQTKSAPKKQALKISKTGMEAELFLISRKGRIANEAGRVIDAVKRAHPQLNIVPESGKNIIEFGCYPHSDSHNPALDLLTSIEKTIDICEPMGIQVYPFGTYPGRFNPVINRKPGYLIKQKIVGNERFQHAGRCASLHIHYSLPKSVYDNKERMVRILKKGKLGRSLTSSYNFTVASDPALALYLQSSPFYQGRHIAKDSRMVMYRGGTKLRSPDGLYAKMQQIGGLPPYKETLTDYLSSINKRWIRWIRAVKKADPDANIKELYPSKLDIGWGPMRINKLGTVEERGLDMNYLSISIAAAVLWSSCMRLIQQHFIRVQSADFAVEEPFKLEDDTLYIPPHTYVRNNLQRWSAYKGYAKKEMHQYATRFLKFAKSVTKKKYSKLIRPVEEMVESKKSRSDRILAYAKTKGWLSDGSISDRRARELALVYAAEFRKDILKTKKEIERITLL